MAELLNICPIDLFTPNTAPSRVLLVTALLTGSLKGTKLRRKYTDIMTTPAQLEQIAQAVDGTISRGENNALIFAGSPPEPGGSTGEGSSSRSWGVLGALPVAAGSPFGGDAAALHVPTYAQAVQTA